MSSVPGPRDLGVDPDVARHAVQHGFTRREAIARDAMLGDLQRESFGYFVHEVNEANGLVLLRRSGGFEMGGSSGGFLLLMMLGGSGGLGFQMVLCRRSRVLLFSAASFVVVLVGFSRIALGAHYLTDVVGGMFFGMMWLTLCLFVARPFRRVSLPEAVAEMLPAHEPELVPIPVKAGALVPAPDSIV